MRANPGGMLGPEEVVGRDTLISELWEILDRQSVVLVAERRIGKTSTIRRMLAHQADHRLTFYRDVEGCATVLEFVQGVLSDVERYLGKIERTITKTRAFLAEICGQDMARIGRIPKTAFASWKAILTKCVEELAENQKHLVVFFWDELPLMVKNVIAHDGERTAMELLDLLRYFRQNHARIRMVYTGSIGLHNVIRSLREAGYANDPTNDMHVKEVPPLSLSDAERLAALLIEGESIATSSSDDVANKIALEVDCNPYFIQHVAGQMKSKRSHSWTLEDVETLVADCLVASQDPWHLRHYYDRINDYYEESERPIILAILDVLASEEGPVSAEYLFNLVKSQVTVSDKQSVVDLAVLLKDDHYLSQDRDGAFGFRFSLIKRWWRIYRGL